MDEGKERDGADIPRGDPGAPEMAAGSKTGGSSGPAARVNLAETPEFPTRVAWLFYGAMAAVACGIHALHAGTLPWLALDPPAPDAGFGLGMRIGLGAAAGLAAVWISRVLTEHVPQAAALSAELGRAIGPIGPGTAWGLALASGLAEELLFRGALQPLIGAIAATVLFAAVHYLPGRGMWVWTVFALVGGFGLAGLFVWTGDLVAPVTAHVVLNGLNLSWLGAKNRAEGAGFSLAPQ